MRRRLCERLCARRYDNRVLALRIYNDDRNPCRSAALGRNPTCVDTIPLQISKHLLAEVIRADPANEATAAGASCGRDRLVRALPAGIKGNAVAEHRLPGAWMP